MKEFIVQDTILHIFIKKLLYKSYILMTIMILLISMMYYEMYCKICQNYENDFVDII